MKIRIALLGLSLLLTASVAARGGMSGPISEEVLQKLGVDAQKAQTIRSLIRSAREEAKTAKSQLKEARKELKSLMKDFSSTESQVRQAHQRVAGLREEMLLSLIRTRNEISGMLTPEQREKFQRALANRMSGRGNSFRMGRRGAGRGMRMDEDHRERLRERLESMRERRRWRDEDEDDFDDLDDMDDDD